ncbi:MAG: hypothetical protein M9905_04230 [Rhizobiaceae bacterium]|nr:hypothetical protein [Rhizobiaceae bacterium]
MTTYLLRVIFGADRRSTAPTSPGSAPSICRGSRASPCSGHCSTASPSLFCLSLILVGAGMSSLPATGSAFASEPPAKIRARSRPEASTPTKVRLLALMMCGALCGLCWRTVVDRQRQSVRREHERRVRAGSPIAVLLTRGKGVAAVLHHASVRRGRQPVVHIIQGLGMPQQFTDMMPYLATLSPC